MTRWKWDAEPGDVLNPHRIPVTSGTPLYPYIASLDKRSPHWPTAQEILQIRSFIEEHADCWLSQEQTEANRSYPFDIDPNHNTVIFHKYRKDDWAYRRKSWPNMRFSPPSPRVSTRVTGPMTLVEVMDLVHWSRTGPDKRWQEWKSARPDVFR